MIKHAHEKIKIKRIKTEFFTISNSVRSGSSRSELPLTSFVGIEYLLRGTGSSKGQLP